MTIQIALIVLILAIAVYALQNRKAIRLQAGKKLLPLVFVVASAVSIIRPAVLTDIAHEVGVGRGTDLLLYVLIVAFVFGTVSTYLRFKDYESQLVKLARRLAIAEANERRRDQEADARARV